jgi:proton glutamate symport protein
MTFNSHVQAKRIGFAVIAGLIFGLILYFSHLSYLSEWIKPVGVVFIRLLKMIIIPLVVSSVFLSVLNLGDAKNLTQLGSKALIYYCLTTFFAVLLALVLVNIFQPGIDSGIVVKTQMENINAASQPQQAGLLNAIVDVLVDAIPTNPVEALSKNHMLQVIVFALIFGVAALFQSRQASPLIELMRSIESISHLVTHGIMLLAPFGIFALMTDVVANAGPEALKSLLQFVLVVVLALIIHSVLLLVYAHVKGAIPFKKLLKDLSPMMLTAFTTSSSAATLPVTMACVTEELKVREKTANFMLPLGATINMDGTAIYIAISTVFIAQIYAIDLTLVQNFIILITATLAAIGTAAVPGASLVTMGIVLSAVNVPLEGIQIIIAVDRILDMCRTTTNVLGDAVGCVVVDAHLKKHEQIGV